MRLAILGLVLLFAGWMRRAEPAGARTEEQVVRGVDAFTWMQLGGEWRSVSLVYTDEPGEARSAP